MNKIQTNKFLDEHEEFFANDFIDKGKDLPQDSISDDYDECDSSNEEDEVEEKENGKKIYSKKQGRKSPKDESKINLIPSTKLILFDIEKLTNKGKKATVYKRSTYLNRSKLMNKQRKNVSVSSSDIDSPSSEDINATISKAEEDGLFLGQKQSRKKINLNRINNRFAKRTQKPSSSDINLVGQDIIVSPFLRIDRRISDKDCNELALYTPACLLENFNQ